MYMKDFIENKWRSKEMVKLLHLDIILTKGDKLRISDKTKEKSSWASRGDKMWAEKNTGETNGR